MATVVYTAKALTGGAGTALDFIDGEGLNGDDFAFVDTGSDFYTYHLTTSSTATESSPYVIAPDTNPSTKRWILVDNVAANWNLIASPNTDHKTSGLVAPFTAGETVAIGEAVYLKSDGSVWKSDADTQATMPVFGLSMAATTAGGSGDILLSGIARDDSWSWTAGSKVYASAAAGALTQTEPVSGDQTQCVGIAQSSNIMYFNPNYTESEQCKIKTGTYTGDGTTAQAITGVGFRPKCLIITAHPTSETATWSFFKLDVGWGEYSIYHDEDDFDIIDDRVTSLGADGFTVDDEGGDNVPNSNGGVYDYVAWG
jgi:hypothetical protein